VRLTSLAWMQNRFGIFNLAFVGIYYQARRAKARQADNLKADYIVYLNVTALPSRVGTQPKACAKQRNGR